MKNILWAEGLLGGFLALGCCSWAGEVCAPGTCERDRRYDGLILSYSQRHGLNPTLVKAIISVESQFATWAVSPAGARGLMQVMPSTAAEVGVPPSRLHDAEANIAAGTAYLGRLVAHARARYGIAAQRPLPPWLQRRVIAAYHGGPRNIGPRAWAPSTRLYVRDVLRAARSRLSRVSARERDFRVS